MLRKSSSSSSAVSGSSSSSSTSAFSPAPPPARGKTMSEGALPLPSIKDRSGSIGGGGPNSGAVSKAVTQAEQQRQKEQQKRSPPASELDMHQLLTQARNEHEHQASFTGVGVTYKLRVEDNLTASQRAKYEAERRKPLNISPINAKSYLPLLKVPPPDPSKKLLLLDLDETLVHSSYFRPATGFDVHIVCRPDPRGPSTDVYVKLRPHLSEFLAVARKLFEVVLYTASVECYARPLMQYLEQRFGGGSRSRIFAEPLLFRDHCTNFNGKFLKDLSLLGRDLSRLVLIDNSPHVYVFQPRNAVPISSYFSEQQNPGDEELPDLIPLLERLAAAPDVYDVLDVFRATRESRAKAPSKSQNNGF